MHASRLVVLLGALAGSCNSTTPSVNVSSPPVELRAVALPDLSRMEPSVQRQMRDAYESLQKLTKNGEDVKAPPTELGAAYGEMGNLLLAAEYLDAAEDCYVNAQALNSGDVRWSYYL